MPKDGIIVLVCGGRDYQDEDFVWHTLDTIDSIFRIGLIVNGAAKGADRFSSNWAEDTNTPCKEVPADWDKHGKRAGPIRNQEILDRFPIDLVIAFEGGTGTADMVSRACKARILVLEADRTFDSAR